jgi:paraquat-inducible protein B
VTTPVQPRLVGAFTLVGLVLTVLGFVAIGSGRLFQQYRTFVVFFPNPVGLKAGAPVTFRQAPLGEVREVEVVFTGRGLETEVKVVADVRRGQLRDIAGRPYVSRLSDKEFADSLVKAGLRASVRSSSPLAGQKSLDFDFHPDLEPRFSGIPMPYPEVPTAPTGMEILHEKVEQALEKISDIPVDEVLTQVRSTLESAQNLLDNGDLQGAVRNLRRGLETADRTLTQAQRTLGSLDGLVGDTRKTITSADTTMRRLDSTLERMDRTLATVDRNVERTADTQYTAGKSLDELGELLRSVRYLVDTLQRHPESLLQGKPEPKEKD